MISLDGNDLWVYECVCVWWQNSVLLRYFYDLKRSEAGGARNTLSEYLCEDFVKFFLTQIVKMGECISMKS